MCYAQPLFIASRLFVIIKTMVAKFFQIASWPFFITVFNLFLNLKIRGRENLKGLSAPLLIIANHKAFYDSFIFRVAMGVNSKLLPLRFMATKNFYSAWLNFLVKIKIIDLVYYMFGAFPVVRGDGLEKALEAPKEILKNNGVVAMFPEGSVYHKEGIGEFKRGAPALAQMTGVTVLPTAFKISKRKFLRKEFIVNFGKPFKIPEGLSYEEGADYMRSIILNLYEK